MSRSEGFTILEIVVAMAILSISLVAILSAHNRALIMGDDAVRLTDAVHLAREEMEKIHLNRPLPKNGESDFQQREDYPKFKWRTTMEETPIEGAWIAVIVVYESEEDRMKELFKLTSYVRG